METQEYYKEDNLLQRKSETANYLDSSNSQDYYSSNATDNFDSEYDSFIEKWNYVEKVDEIVSGHKSFHIYKKVKELFVNSKFIFNKYEIEEDGLLISSKLKINYSVELLLKVYLDENPGDGFLLSVYKGDKKIYGDILVFNELVKFLK